MVYMFSTHLGRGTDRTKLGRNNFASVEFEARRMTVHIGISKEKISMFSIVICRVSIPSGTLQPMSSHALLGRIGSPSLPGSNMVPR